MESNPMREPVIDKVTVNVGVGSPGDRMDGIKAVMEKLAGSKFIETKARKRNPVFKLRVGLPIGLKTTLRGKKALDFLNRALDSRKRKISASYFDKLGNFSFGVKEYIDFPGAKYNPAVGVFGFDVCVTLKRRGKRVSERMRVPGKTGRKHLLTKEDGVEFAKSKLNAKMEEVL
ncbi:MAG: 50S ribosomal protein L5 [Candidatus ainarchaeum sp.]|nr:50S ribosomal protein L5 [Candidatus ainarchaeum sp.]